MKIETFISPYLGALCYLLKEDQHAVLIDPVETKELEDTVEGLQIDYSLITHEHWDHISGIPFSKKRGAQVVCGALCAEGLKNPKINGSRYATQLATMMPEYGSDESLNVPEMVFYSDLIMQDGETLTWQDHIFRFYQTPGHSPGSCCILLDDNCLFSGDLLFLDRPTQYRWPGGNKKALLISLEWAMSLNPDLMVYPGHFAPFLLHESYEYKKRTGENK